MKEKNETGNQSFYTIDFTEMLKNKQLTLLSDIADSIEYIVLETSPNCMLGRIIDIKDSKDYIFIEHNGQGNLSQFDRNGNFIRNVCKIGHGPEEIPGIRGFSIDESQKLIYVQANWVNKMLIYSFEGEYIKSIDLSGERGHVVWGRDSLFVCFREPSVGNENYIFEEINSKGHILQTVSNNCKWQKDLPFGRSVSFKGRNNFYRLNNKLHFKGDYNDTVYTYNNANKIIPKFYFNLGKYKLPDEMRVERGMNPDEIPAQYYWDSILESPSYVFIHYGTYAIDIKGKEEKLADEGYICYEKRMRTGYTLRINDMKLGCVNDVDAGLEFTPDYIEDSLAYHIISAYEISNHLNSEQFEESKCKFPGKKEEFKHIMDKISENDNPVIMIVKLK